MILACGISCINLTFVNINDFWMPSLYFDNFFYSFITKTNASFSLFVFWFSEEYLCTWYRIFSLSTYPTTMLLCWYYFRECTNMYLFLLLFQKSSAQHSCILSLTLKSWMKYIITNFVQVNNGNPVFEFSRRLGSKKNVTLVEVSEMNF